MTSPIILLAIAPSHPYVWPPPPRRRWASSASHRWRGRPPTGPVKTTPSSMRSHLQQPPERPISGVRPAVSWLPPRRVFQKLFDKGGLHGAGRPHHNHPCSALRRLLGPKLIEAMEEQDHKTARRRADLLPVLKGGGSLWAGKHPRQTLKASSGWGHDVARASTTGHSTPSRALLQKRDILKNQLEGRGFRLL